MDSKRSRLTRDLLQVACQEEEEGVLRYYINFMYPVYLYSFYVRVWCVCHRAAMEGARSQGHAENISTLLQLNLGLKHTHCSTILLRTQHTENLL